MNSLIVYQQGLDEWACKFPCAAFTLGGGEISKFTDVDMEPKLENNFGESFKLQYRCIWT